MTLTTHLFPVELGTGYDAGFVQFVSSHHCCVGCEEGHDGDTEGSSSPVYVKVVHIEGRKEGAAALELRWEMFSKPQVLRLSPDAVALLVLALEEDPEAGGWVRNKVKP